MRATICEDLAISDGDGVTRFRRIPWLDLADLYYWGDLDADGFRILANLRRSDPQVQSLLMDRHTFQVHRHRAVAGNGRQFDAQPTLTESKNGLLQYFAQENLRLEQETLRDSHVNSAIRRIFE